MANLKPGDPAPGFTFTDPSGSPRNLTDYLGRKVILYFYPKDNTPGCTLEACSLRDGYDELRAKGFEVIGVSADSDKSHAGFRSKFKLPFALVADTEKQVLNAYGVWAEKQFMGKKFMGVVRTTFIIDENGRIDRILEKVDTKDHAGQIMREMKI